MKPDVRPVRLIRIDPKGGTSIVKCPYCKTVQLVARDEEHQFGGWSHVVAPCKHVDSRPFRASSPRCYVVRFAKEAGK